MISKPQRLRGALCRWTLLCGFLFFQTSCSGWSSELDTAFIDDNPKSQQPVCTFEPLSNCYSRAIQSLQNCLPPMQEEMGQFSDGFAECDYDVDKTISFQNKSMKEYLEFDDVQTLHFIALSGAKECFEFKGQEDDFSITLSDLREMHVKRQANGDIEIQCFSNESFTVTQEVQTQGCRDVKASPSSFVPRIEMKKSYSSRQKLDFFQFAFLGLGPSQLLFKCRP
jgi:hypothetical protein